MAGMIPELSKIKDKLVLKLDSPKEMDLIITKMYTDKWKSGQHCANFIISMDGEDDAKEIFHACGFGNFGDFQEFDTDKSETIWRMLKEFIRSLGLDPDKEHPAEDFEDLEFVGLVGYNNGEVEDDNGNMVPMYPEKNVLLKVIPQGN